MKKKIACLFFIAVALLIYAQNPQRPLISDLSWKILEKAQIAFDRKDYGLAIKYTEQAKQNRKNEVAWSIYELNQALKPSVVRDVGDDIDDVIKVLEQRNSYDALAILDELFIKVSKAELRFSIAAAVDRIQKSASYPEADFLLGQLFAIEGEYSLALDYLTAAWKNSYLLDIPAQKKDILYQMAYLAKNQNNIDTYEKTLLLLISDDQLFSDSGEQLFVTAVIQAIDKGISLDKFFNLYRNNNYNSLKAYQLLTELYFESGNIDKAVRMSSVACLAAFTRLFAVLKDKNIDYIYTDFNTFLKAIDKYTEVVDWSVRNEVWKGFYTFAKILNQYGKMQMASEIYTSLAQYCPEDYWKRLSFKEIKN